MQRLVSRTRSWSSMIQATTEVLIDCFLNSIKIGTRAEGRGTRKSFSLRIPRSAFLVPLFFSLSLHRGNAQTQGIKLDEAFGVGLVIDLVGLEGGEVDVEQAVCV